MELQEGKYLTFSLGKEAYGVHILKVKEIIGMKEITPTPGTPKFIKGVINLRGKIIPIMDLRLKFNLEEKPYNERTGIIVVETNSNATHKQIGVAVDAISDVVNIGRDEIEPPPQYEEEGIDFLTGIGKLKDKIVMLLNTERVFSTKDLHLSNAFLNELRRSE